MMAFQVVVVLLTLFSRSVMSSSKPGETSGMDEEKRDLLLKLHNDYRYKIAIGHVYDRLGNAQPKAANMFKLKYSKKLEKSAQQAANSCANKYERGLLTGENIAWDRKRNINGSFETWTNGDITRTTFLNYDKLNWNKVVSDQIWRFTQIVWAKTKKIGCGYKLCKWWFNLYVGYLVCRYDPGGNIANVPIYEKGQPCTKCEKHGGQCSNDGVLCEFSPNENGIKSFKEPTSYYDGMANENGMNDNSRKLLLDQHNFYRLKFAQGKERDRLGILQPKVANMFKMEYSLEVEKTAQKWADRCIFDHEGSSNPYGDNLIKHNGRNLTDMMELWTTEEIRSVYNVNYDRLNWHWAKSNNVGHFTQIIWATSRVLGCGYRICRWDNWTWGYLVCRYHPPGNYIGSAMFNKGEPCSKCEQYSGKCAQGQYAGLCEIIE